MKKILSLCALLGFTLMTGFSQTPTRDTQPSTQTTYAKEVAAYLSLTAAQLDLLTSVKLNFDKASEGLRKQTEDKRLELGLAIRANADTTTLGKLTQELAALGTQMAALTASYTPQAVAVLNADQKTKLKVLNDASKLQVEVGQATYLFLIAQ